MEVDDVQFRAGTINSAKQQKGVDSLIVTDLIELTTHHAICDAILVTGDSDLAVGIEIAQKRGIRITVLGLEDLAAGVAHHQSWEITSRADRVGRLGISELVTAVRFAKKPASGSSTPKAKDQLPADVPNFRKNPTSSPRPELPVIAAPQRVLSDSDKTEITAVVLEFIKELPALTRPVDATTSRIDAQIDRTLIHFVFSKLNRGQLTNAEKIHARAEFRTVLATR